MRRRGAALGARTSATSASSTTATSCTTRTPISRGGAGSRGGATATCPSRWCATSTRRSSKEGSALFMHFVERNRFLTLARNAPWSMFAEASYEYLRDTAVIFDRDVVRRVRHRSRPSPGFALRRLRAYAGFLKLLPDTLRTRRGQQVVGGRARARSSNGGACRGEGRGVQRALDHARAGASSSPAVPPPRWPDATTWSCSSTRRFDPIVASERLGFDLTALPQVPVDQGTRRVPRGERAVRPRGQHVVRQLVREPGAAQPLLRALPDAEPDPIVARRGDVADRVDQPAHVVDRARARVLVARVPGQRVLDEGRGHHRPRRAARGAPPVLAVALGARVAARRARRTSPCASATTSCSTARCRTGAACPSARRSSVAVSPTRSRCTSRRTRSSPGSRAGSTTTAASAWWCRTSRSVGGSRACGPVRSRRWRSCRRAPSPPSSWSRTRWWRPTRRTPRDGSRSSGAARPPCSRRPVRLRAGGAKQPVILAVGRFFPNVSGHSKKQLELVEAFRLAVRAGSRDGSSTWWADATTASAATWRPCGRPRWACPCASTSTPAVRTSPSSSRRRRCSGTRPGFGEDLQTHPDRFEHFGISVVEAMSAGAVPVVYEHGGPAAIVRESGCGELFATTDELAAKTVALVRDDARRCAARGRGACPRRGVRVRPLRRAPRRAGRHDDGARVSRTTPRYPIPTAPGFVDRAVVRLGTLAPIKCPVCGKLSAARGFGENLRETGRCRTCGATNRNRQVAYVAARAVAERTRPRARAQGRRPGRGGAGPRPRGVQHRGPGRAARPAARDARVPLQRVPRAEPRTGRGRRRTPRTRTSWRCRTTTRRST